MLCSARGEGGGRVCKIITKIRRIGGGGGGVGTLFLLVSLTPQRCRWYGLIGDPAVDTKKEIPFTSSGLTVKKVALVRVLAGL